ncbi:hypothetical protein EJ110_NYTH23859 [Nymphaea thermarum]|nr:hypothetical protein EJ110_NYTH23859 [Nymphaea thermarum]
MGRVVAEKTQTPLEKRPSILMVGSSNAGKRTLLSRLISEDFLDMGDTTSKSCYGWTIDTKYYLADLSIWVEHLGDSFPENLSVTYQQPLALVMVFDQSNMSSFVALQDWVSVNSLQNFEILLCIGNKADLVPNHFAFTEYRRRLQKHGECSSDPHPEFLDYGILDNEGCSLLSGDEVEADTSEIGRLCMDWCREHNIEYVEACAANADFDKCLSTNGDIQGVDRVYGALSAYMWPGLIMKSENKMPHVCAYSFEKVSSDESDIEIEYEVLSKGSAEPWDDTDDTWVALSSTDRAEDSKEIASEDVPVDKGIRDSEQCKESAPDGLVSTAEELASSPKAGEGTTEPEHVDTNRGFEDLEQLMCEISHMRENLRLMPDMQRKEMAAALAMKMAGMFADGSDEDAS